MNIFSVYLINGSNEIWNQHNNSAVKLIFAEANT